VGTVPRGLGVLQVEPTDRCNLACAMCAPHAESWPTVHGIPKGSMPLELYERVLAGLVRGDCHFDHLILQWLGDPSLHPELERMVGLAGRVLGSRVGHVRVDSNGLLLNEKRLDTMLAEKAVDVPLLLVFTLDAATPATYRRVKGREGLERVRRHVRHLLRNRAGAGRVDVQVQFVVQPGNAHEARAFLDYWASLAACHPSPGGHLEVMFKRLSVGGGARGQADVDALYERTLREADIAGEQREGFSVSVWERRPWQVDDAHAGRGPCPGAWLTPVVRHDGELLMCCADLGSELRLGSLADHDFRTLWEGEAATRLRLAHLAGRFDGVCARCGGVNWYDLPPGAAAATRVRAAALGIAEAAR
jgi:MoaA/NifB/PqqE/SkfB family radical SAM enzyme